MIIRLFLSPCLLPTMANAQLSRLIVVSYSRFLPAWAETKCFLFMLELWWDLTTNLKNISPSADPPLVLYVVCWVFWWLLRFNFLDDMWPCKSSAPPQHRANPDRRQHLGGLAELHTAASHCAVAARATPKLIDLVWQSSTAVANEGAGPMKATRCNTWGSHDESSNHGKPEN